MVNPTAGIQGSEQPASSGQMANLWLALSHSGESREGKIRKTDQNEEAGKHAVEC